MIKYYQGNRSYKDMGSYCRICKGIYMGFYKQDIDRMLMDQSPLSYNQMAYKNKFENFLQKNTYLNSIMKLISIKLKL